jgi:hypothetical protein
MRISKTFEVRRYVRASFAANARLSAWHRGWRGVVGDELGISVETRVVIQSPSCFHLLEALLKIAHWTVRLLSSSSKGWAMPNCLLPSTRRLDRRFRDRNVPKHAANPCA